MAAPRPRQPVSRLALRIDEAAEAIGVSRNHFDEHVRPYVRSVRLGKALVYPVSELEKFIEQNMCAPGETR